MNEPSPMDLFVDSAGDIRCIYGEELDLWELGKLQITRASHVEPDRDGFWWADMGPVGGPVLGPFKNRTEALQAERGWLEGDNGVGHWRFRGDRTQPQTLWVCSQPLTPIAARAGLCTDDRERDQASLARSLLRSPG